MVRRSALRAPPARWLRLLRLHAQFLFFLFLDDDSRRDHHHQALGFAADAHVLEQPVDVGILSSMGTPNSLRPSLSRLMPPSSTVPPSGTLTVVVTVTKEKRGQLDRRAGIRGRACCRRSDSTTWSDRWRPVEGPTAWCWSWWSCVPVNWKVLTAPIVLKKGTTVEPDEAPVVGDHRLDGHERAFGEDDDDRLLGGGEIAHHGDHADDEGALRRVGDDTPAGR